MTPRQPTLRRALIGGLALSAALGVSAIATPTATAGSAAPSERGETRRGNDTPKHPLKIKAKRDAQKQAALQRQVKGRAATTDDRSVRLKNEGTDRIFVVLAEFGDERYPDPRFSDTPTPAIEDPQPQRFDGPLHNQLPKPDRATDNANLWQPDFNRAHYQDMYFNRLKSYYERQSSGRYSVSGDVTEWVKVPFNQALYGRDYCGDIVCPSTKVLVRDALAMWVDQQLNSGKTMADITTYLKTFDKQDRYDIDGDGNLAEPDGFIDHFQIVHAGGDEASNDKTYGSDAIWSHRWYSNVQNGGPGGLPGVNVGSNSGDLSSTKVPNNPTGVWVGDYTIQPEDGGLGVFVHEYGHDLGLPDLYDTSGNTGGAENSTGFWTLMSSGANIGDGGPDGIGDNPTDLGAWELFQLGWLNAQGNKGPFYDVARAGQTSTHTLGTNTPATSSGAQALFTVLPDREVPLNLGAPYAGSYQFWSTQGDDLNTSMTHAATPGPLTAQVKYQIETDWDYAFVEAQVNGAWTPVATNLSDSAGDQSGFNTSKTGITGAVTSWTGLTATLPAGTTAVRFRYQSDGAVAEPGFRVDQVAVNGTVIGTAENDAEGWTFNGFRRTTGSEIEKFFNAYVAENRQYDGYDSSLQTAYNFSQPLTKPDWVESYPYQNGLLLSYWNGQYTDNNVGDHPGAGLILPIDAHPALPHWSDGTLMRPRIATYDSTFGLERTDAITLHTQTTNAAGKVVNLTGSVASQPAVPTFDDTLTWWFGTDAHVKKGAHPGRYQPGWYSVNPPKTGTTITVQSASGSSMSVKVAPK